MVFLSLIIFLLFNRINSREKIRALWNLNSMTECKLGYSALNYNNYGCWCGIGGYGTPMDGIDACCKTHDQCYDAASDDGSCVDWFSNTIHEYLTNYPWYCNSKTKEISCPADENNACKRELCQCDKHVVDCWAQQSRPSNDPGCRGRAINEENANRKFHTIATVRNFSVKAKMTEKVSIRTFLLVIKDSFVDLFTYISKWVTNSINIVIEFFKTLVCIV